jgi:hypothetical protein
MQLKLYNVVCNKTHLELNVQKTVLSVTILIQDTKCTLHHN